MFHKLLNEAIKDYQASKAKKPPALVDNSDQPVIPKKGPNLREWLNQNRDPVEDNVNEESQDKIEHPPASSPVKKIEVNENPIPK